MKATEKYEMGESVCSFALLASSSSHPLRQSPFLRTRRQVVYYSNYSMLQVQVVYYYSNYSTLQVQVVVYSSYYTIYTCMVVQYVVYLGYSTLHILVCATS